MKKQLLIFSIFTLLISCGKEENKTQQHKENRPTVRDQGNIIKFPDEKTMSFFETETVGKKKLEAQLKAPAKLVATVLSSSIDASQNVILFDDSDLASHYTQLIQVQTNILQLKNVSIKQKELELERTKDLSQHGSATGQELLAAETELAIEKSNLQNAQSALIEHETQLRAGGFNPKALQNAKAGTAYLICDIPENQVSKIEIGQTSHTIFTAFPNEEIKGEINAIADMVNSSTRMVKVRVEIDNASKKLKTGMFANASFDLTQGEFISINQSSLVTIKGHHYVFIKKSADEFERREIQIGQQMGDHIIVFGGLEDDEEIVNEGVMQLKGLSFGY
ncbi:MAG: efflux RND transporter periplasmic adaptor subunit [Psychroflexus sp.]|nr:efflux RND transporter periplasmic adaptor subunit [Psychroflexus sp.]MDN6309398.1 efflux RND transporter periplasmic adaptor subunit [Psychroflexus sp.]